MLGGDDGNDPGISWEEVPTIKGVCALATPVTIGVCALDDRPFSVSPYMPSRKVLAAVIWASDESDACREESKVMSVGRSG